jgi:hypothetical protein
LLWQFSMTRLHIGPAKLAIKTTINGNSILVGNGSFRFRTCSTGKRCSISVSTSAKEFPFPFPFRKIPFLFSYFHSVSIFPRKSRKVSAPLSSLVSHINHWHRRQNCENHNWGPYSKKAHKS